MKARKCVCVYAAGVPPLVIYVAKSFVKKKNTHTRDISQNWCDYVQKYVFLVVGLAELNYKKLFTKKSG